MTFDPRKYVGSSPARPAGFDPSRYTGQPVEEEPQRTEAPRLYSPVELAEMGIIPEGSAPPPDMRNARGYAETVLNKSTNALPFGRPVVDALSAGVRKLLQPSPGAQVSDEVKQYATEHGESIREAPGLVDLYRDSRDTRDIRTAAGELQNPGLSKFGTGLGITLSLLAPGPKSLKGAGAAGVAARGARVALPRVMAQGAGLGAAQAFGDSRADLTTGQGDEWIQAARDTATGAAFGAGGGLVGYQAGRYAPTLLRAAGRGLNRLGVAQGRRALLSGADSLTKNVTSDEAVEEAIRSGGILPFGTTKGAAQRLERSREALGATYSQTVDRLEELGVQGADAHALADKLFDAGNDAYYASSANKAPVAILKNEAANVRELAQRNAGSAALPGAGPTRGARPRLGLRQTERIKQDLQGQVNYSPLVDKRNNDALMEAAALIRGSTEEAIDEAAQRAGPGSEIAELGETFVPVKRRLGLTIEASDAANRGAQKAANRSMFGLPEVLAATSTGEPVSGVAAAFAMQALRSRGPSTVASAGYWGGRGADGLARLAAPRAATGVLPIQAARTVNALERPTVGADLPLLPDDEERLRRQAWLDVLRGMESR